MKQGLLLLVMAGILGAGAGWMFTRLVLEDESASPLAGAAANMEDLVGLRRPDFTLGSADGERVSAAQFDGRVILLNFWATWCVPCRAEMPMLLEVHDSLEASGFSVVGIALDDVQQAREFAQELGISYPVLVGGADVLATGMAYGNRAGLLPYSVLIDRAGIVRWTHLGEVEKSDLLERLETIL